MLVDKNIGRCIIKIILVRFYTNTLNEKFLRELLKAAADARVGVRRTTVAHVKQTKVQILVIATTNEQTWAGSAEVPAIAGIGAVTPVACR